jgi:hypothetical protein
MYSSSHFNKLYVTSMKRIVVLTDAVVHKYGD